MKSRYSPDPTALTTSSPAILVLSMSRSSTALADIFSAASSSVPSSSLYPPTVVLSQLSYREMIFHQLDFTSSLTCRDSLQNLFASSMMYTSSSQQLCSALQAADDCGSAQSSDGPGAARAVSSIETISFHRS